MELPLASLLILVPLTVQLEYLANLSANESDPNLIANHYRNQSPTKPYAIDAPRLYNQDGHYRGKLSTNQYNPNWVSSFYGRYGNPYSSEWLNNLSGLYGAGNLYRQA